MSNEQSKFCPFGNECSQDCMLSIWICGVNGHTKTAACALAVLAARGTNDSVNMIPITIRKAGDE